MMALLPPSSSKLLPRRSATRTPICRPTCVEPVNETSATRRSSTKRIASSVPASMKIWNIAGSECRSRTWLQRCCTASEHSAVLGDGFHTVALPAMAARNAFHDQTATGKLKAEMTPTTPSGCHCSYMRCWARSECIVGPYNMRDCPTAKSAMSIISWTSPSPSALILPFSIDTRLPSASLWRRSSSASRPNHLAALGRRHLAPCGGRFDRGIDNMFVVRRGGAAHLRQAQTCRRIDRLDQGSRTPAGSSRGCPTKFPDCRRQALAPATFR